MSVGIALIQVLEEARKALNISEKELAERMGVQRSTITRLFNASHPNSTLDTITNILRALGLQAEIKIRPVSPAKPTFISAKSKTLCLDLSSILIQSQRLADGGARGEGDHGGQGEQAEEDGEQDEKGAGDDDGGRGNALRQEECEAARSSASVGEDEAGNGQPREAVAQEEARREGREVDNALC